MDSISIRTPLDYDHLVLALGSVTNFYDIPNLAETATQMKTLGDAIGLRNRLIELEEAATECAAKDQEPLLTLWLLAADSPALKPLGVSTTSSKRPSPTTRE
jgi:NADH dehydrogenase FAD-containing subunit